MHYPILDLSVSTQRMRNNKASRGGEKTTVKMTIRHDSTFTNRADIRIVFHNDMVYITEIRYNERFVKDDRLYGHMEKSDFSEVIKSSYPFNTCVHGCTYDGNLLDPIAMADLALKMYRKQYLDFRPYDTRYLWDIKGV